MGKNVLREGRKVYRGIIFDLDGTLLDTLEDLARSVNAVLERRGFPTHPVEAYRYFIGEGMETLLERALPAGEAAGDLVKALAIDVREEYHRRWPDHTRPYRGIPELLTFLEARGIPKAVLSNKPHEFTVITVESLLGRWSFEAVRGAMPGLPRKPDPAGALAMAELMGLPPSVMVLLGDSDVDMQTARAAGMYPAGALWGFRDLPELLAAGAKLLAEKPMDVSTLFTGEGCL